MYQYFLTLPLHFEIASKILPKFLYVISPDNFRVKITLSWDMTFHSGNQSNGRELSYLDSGTTCMA
jgi:hypothetical protein